MNVKSTLRGVRLSAQKGRLVADQIRGLPVDRALNILRFSPKKGAAILRKVLESAIVTGRDDGSGKSKQGLVEETSGRLRAQCSLKN